MRIFFLISLLYLSITCVGQTVQSSFNGYGNTSLVTGSGPNFVIGINGFTGSFNNLVDGPFLASDVLVGDIIWYDCTRFVITGVNSFSSTNMNVNVTVPSSDWALGVSTPLINQRVAIIRELPGTVPVFPPTADGNGGSLSGIDNALYSCMMTHYAKVTRGQISEAEEIIFTSGTAPPDNSLATIDGYRLAKNSGGNGDLYLWDGSAWVLSTSGGGSGANTINVMQMAHGFTLSASEPIIAVRFNTTSGLYERANNTDTQHLPSAYIVEIIDAGYFKLAGESFATTVTNLTTNFYYLTSSGTLTSTPPAGIVFQVGVSVPNGSGQQRFRITGVVEAGTGGGGSGVPECSIEVTQVSPTLNVLDRVEWNGTAYVTVTTNANLNSYVVVAKDGDDYTLATCGIYDNVGSDGWLYGVEGSPTIQIVTPTACAPIEGHRTNDKLAIHILPTCTGMPSNTYTGGVGISITGSAPTFTINNLGLLTTTNHLGDITGVYNNLQIEAGMVGTNELASGSVTAAKINQMSATNGQVLKWNSTSQLWEPGTDNNSGLTAIQEEGTPVVSASTINFVGAGVTATGGGSTATITIPKGEISIWYDSTASGGSYRTVTIPSGVKSVKIQACGGGGGGAAGGHRLTSNVSTGGGIGGHGGQIVERNFEFGTCVDCIPSNVTLTYDIGAGGSGGAAKAGTGAALSGNTGSPGGSTTIKVNNVIFIKTIGGPGAPNCTTTGDGTPKIMIPSFYPSAPGNTGIPDESIGPGAGGYGGVNGAAGNAGGAGSGLSVTTAAGSNATASISKWHTGGNGGGGGTSGNAANGTAGGNGTQGSGGGGGGQVINSTASFTSGAGGNGGDGWVRFIFYY